MFIKANRGWVIPSLALLCPPGAVFSVLKGQPWGLFALDMTAKAKLRALFDPAWRPAFFLVLTIALAALRLSSLPIPRSGKLEMSALVARASEMRCLFIDPELSGQTMSQRSLMEQLGW